MIVIPLQSGSNGNCIYVESGDTSLLIDAGISGRCVEARLAIYGRQIDQVDALLITHEHSDHVRCAGVLSRKYGIPVHITQKTLIAASNRRDIGLIASPQIFQSGHRICVKGLSIQSIPTPHDACDGSVFVVSDGKRKVGIFTDLGHVYLDLKKTVEDLDAVFLESNYDDNMLKTGSYPGFLKRRIAGKGGHISNRDSAKLLRNHSMFHLQWACLGHLSEKNNNPEVALATHRKINPDGVHLFMAERYKPGPLMEIH